MRKGREYPDVNVISILNPFCVYKISCRYLLIRYFSHAASAPDVVKQVKSIEKVDTQRYVFKFTFYA